MTKTPNFANFNIYLLERFLDNFMLLPFIILEIFLKFETDISNSHVHTKLGKINFLIFFGRDMISA